MTRERTAILLVDESPGYADLLRGLLAETFDVASTLDWTPDAAIALERICSGTVDVLLLDLSCPRSASLQKQAQNKRVPVIVLAAAESDPQALRSVREGAQDYLVKGNISAGMLAHAIRSAIERHRFGVVPSSRNRGRVLAFLGSKGGVGTTTVTLNVACSLARRGNAVISLELDSGHGTFCEFLPQRPPLRNLGPLLKLAPERIDGAALALRLGDGPDGLRVLSSPSNPAECVPISSRHAEAILRSLAGMTQFVVADLPCSPLESNAAATHLCDFVGLVLDREPATLGSARRRLALMKNWIRPGAIIGAIVLNRAALVCPVPLDEIAQQLGCPISAVLQPAPDDCVLAQRMHLPLVVALPETLLAESLSLLAGKLAGDDLYRAAVITA